MVERVDDVHGTIRSDVDTAPDDVALLTAQLAGVCPALAPGSDRQSLTIEHAYAIGRSIGDVDPPVEPDSEAARVLQWILDGEFVDELDRTDRWSCTRRETGTAIRRRFDIRRSSCLVIGRGTRWNGQQRGAATMANPAMTFLNDDFVDMILLLVPA